MLSSSWPLVSSMREVKDREVSLASLILVLDFFWNAAVAPISDDVMLKNRAILKAWLFVHSCRLKAEIWNKWTQMTSEKYILCRAIYDASYTTRIIIDCLISWLIDANLPPGLGPWLRPVFVYAFPQDKDPKQRQHCAAKRERACLQEEVELAHDCVNNWQAGIGGGWCNNEQRNTHNAGDQEDIHTNSDVQCRHRIRKTRKDDRVQEHFHYIRIEYAPFTHTSSALSLLLWKKEQKYILFQTYPILLPTEARIRSWNLATAAAGIVGCMRSCRTASWVVGRLSLPERGTARTTYSSSRKNNTVTIRIIFTLAPKNTEEIAEVKAAGNHAINTALKFSRNR